MSSDADVIRRARMRVAEKITDLIGDTPIVRLQSFEKDTPGVEIWAKCEFFNPGGSVKDRAAYQMIRDAIRTGLLAPGKTIIDSTSGNTGVAYSLIGGAMGFPVTLVMPGNVSWARRKITEAFGTKLIFSDPMEGSDGAIRLCRKIVDENPGHYFYPDQYSNLSNPLAHYNTTGREIWEQTEGPRHALRDRHRHDRDRDGDGPAAEGVSSATSRSTPSSRRTRCTGSRASSTWRARWCRRSITRASSTACCRWTPTRPGTSSERLAKHEGMLVGHSSGASLAGGVRIAKRLAAAGKPGVDRDVVPRPRGALLRGAPGKAQVTDKVG